MLKSSTYFSQLYFIENNNKKKSRVAAYANVFTYSNKI